MLEKPVPGGAPWAETIRNLRGYHVVNAVVAFLFASTGPVALILSLSLSGGLGADEVASWIFMGFFGGGVITLLMCWLYQQPLAHAWTISGTAIVAAAIGKFEYAEIVGAYLVTGVLMIALALTGGFRKIMDITPVPIVMAMVAGVFLKFGILAVGAFESAPWIAIAATAAFLLASMSPAIEKRFPPVLAALIAGAIVIAVTGQYVPKAGVDGIIASPKFVMPAFSEGALIELVLPLAISVLALQNAQGIAVLRVAGHSAPSNSITMACGVGSLIFGVFGAVCTCLTGPVNAILASSGPLSRHYIGGYVWAILALLFGLFAPFVVQLALATPEAFIFVLGGLAMLKVLQGSFIAAFSGRYTLGALVTFIVTVTDLIPSVRADLFGIGAPFWGLVFGALVSLILERDHFRADREEKLAARNPK